MSEKRESRRLGRYFRLPERLRWIFWPSLTVSGGGSAYLLWLEGEALALAECAPVAALPGMAALIYWFNHHVFASTRPRRDDLARAPSPWKPPS